MGKSESILGFKLMSYVFRIRDFFSPRINVLNEIGIQPGSVVLDYGCGSGSYILPLSTIIGSSGKIYAVDINPLAITSVEDISVKNSLENVETIQSECKTGLPDESVDVVLLYDIFHELKNSNEILEELNRILKPDGVLSFSDHHMKDHEIREIFTKNSLFNIKEKMT